MLRVKSMIKGLFRLLPMLLLAVACNDNVGVQLPDGPSGDGTGDEEVYDKFYKGTTISFANYVMDLGLVYREAGVETDPYASVKSHGANIVRLQLDRVAFPEYEGVTIDWQQWDRVVEDAKCAKANDLDIMLTLKPDYDIFTATNAMHNNLPEDWRSLDEYNIGVALYEWVY
jgi:arabinogalactan endo-1,4-beta-galactosidase